MLLFSFFFFLIIRDESESFGLSQHKMCFIKFIRKNINTLYIYFKITMLLLSFFIIRDESDRFWIKSTKDVIV